MFQSPQVKKIEQFVDKIIKNQTTNLKINFTQNILFVEGKTDKIMIEKALSILKIKPQFVIIEMKGITNFTKIYQIFHEINHIKVRFLTDNDDSAQKFLKLYAKTDDILTYKIYSRVSESLHELEEVIFNYPHYKNRASKKRIIKFIVNEGIVSFDNTLMLMQTICNSFKK